VGFWQRKWLLEKKLEHVHVTSRRATADGQRGLLRAGKRHLFDGHRQDSFP
jgi:hypothetical protein